MKKLFYTLIVFFLLCSVGFSATYYLRSDGTAAIGSTSGCGATNTAANEAAHNGGSFSGDDIICFCDDGGAYNSAIVPPSSGTSGHQITYQKATGDTPTLTATDQLHLTGKSYITIDGLTFTDGGAKEQLHIDGGSHYVEVANCTFNGGDKRALKVEDSNRAYIHDNTFNTMAEAIDEATESNTIEIHNGEYCRIIDNDFFEGGGHAFIQIAYGSHYNVTRGNTGTVTNHFTNAYAALDMVYETASNANYNLAEDNTWTESTSSIAYCTIHLTSAAYNIYRKNIHDVVYGNFSQSAGASTHEYNTIYNNTFYDVSTASDGFFKYGSGAYDKRYDQIVNNIVHTYPDYSVHIYNYPEIHDNVFRNNCIYSASYTAQVRRKSVNMTFATAESSYPAEFSGNIITQPTFTDAANGDFTADSGSAVQVDAGTYLTLANGSGSDSTSLIVDNPYFFYDGYGITGETADYICIGGTIKQISSINYPAKTITLVVPGIDWSDNAEIRLAVSSTACYYGSETDIGAEEFNEPEAPQPDPMTWATEPAGLSTTSIDMTGTTCTDANPPIEYQFVVSAGACGANYGSGGTTQAFTSAGTPNEYTDDGLDVNQCYSYTAQAQDSDVPTQNTVTSSVDAYTLAATPNASTISAGTDSDTQISFDLLAENGNPAANPDTGHACKVTYASPADADWLNKWIQTGTGNAGASEDWQGNSTWDGLGNCNGFNDDTHYKIACKARNEDGTETALGAEAEITTTGEYEPPPTKGMTGGTWQ